MKAFFLKRKIKKYVRKLEKDGADPVYLRKLGSLYARIAERDAAIAAYRQCIEAYYQDDSRLGKDNEFILAVCEALLQLDPLDRVAHRTLGQEYCSLGEFAKAAELYKACAVTLANAGQSQEAILEYRNALVLFPENLKWRQECFGLLWKLHRQDEAVQELKKIAALAESMGNISKALECYQKALKIAPADAELQTELRRLGHLNRPGEKQLRLVVNNDA